MPKRTEISWQRSAVDSFARETRLRILLFRQRPCKGIRGVIVPTVVANLTKRRAENRLNKISEENTSSGLLIR